MTRPEYYTVPKGPRNKHSTKQIQSDHPTCGPVFPMDPLAPCGPYTYRVNRKAKVNNAISLKYETIQWDWLLKCVSQTSPKEARSNVGNNILENLNILYFKWRFRT